MQSVVYVVRSPLHTLSDAVFSGEETPLVLSLEDPHLPGKVVRTGQNFSLREGETLSYEEVLTILLQSTKVMAL